MTIDGLRNKIKSLGNTMDFCITDVFSWRGVYNEPACSISTDTTSKEHNLAMIDKLLSETFSGWKGGEYTYHRYDDIHFEDTPDSWSNGAYIRRFLLDNADNQDVRSIFY